MAVSAERLGQALQVREREPAGGAVGLDEREQKWTLCRRLRESPIGPVQPAEREVRRGVSRSEQRVRLPKSVPKQVLELDEDRAAGAAQSLREEELFL